MKAKESPPDPGSLQERKQKLARANIAELAAAPLIERGFDDVTIDDLAKAAGISKRTFFRYFSTKEEVVTSQFDEAGTALLTAFRLRPRDEQPLLSLRFAMGSVIDRLISDAERSRAMIQLIHRTPSLRGRFLVTQDQWIGQLSSAIAERLPKGPKAPMLARLTATVSMGAVDAAMMTWAESGDRDIRAVADEAFDALAAVVSAATRTGPGRKS
ncbi:TetR family transcriptional regulator [Archangium lansingense]|uniref:TetR family transcriptional regulator n=1 Tax=Archangium lansingense TaxID=2995310 RepID=A0ABT4AMT0_9BACT|nr:TetR family transcriptional regulator [Archangium lansinium]MCY1082994.1 TetR family transcriptional regulator [Archangium lansinium]